MKTIIHFIGLAGSGKGTQSKILQEKFNWPVIEVGALCRAMAQENSEQGKFIKSIIEKGELIPHELTVAAVLSRIESLESEVVLIDGFPRSVSQADAYLYSLSTRNEFKLFIIHLILGELISEVRLHKRAQIEGRTDDNPETIKKRFLIYHSETTSAIHTLRNSGAEYIAINAEQTIEDVSKDILENLCDKLPQPCFKNYNVL